MIFEKASIRGVFLIALEPHTDDRGSFARVFCQKEFDAAGISFRVVQTNLAYTRYAGTVRGLHYQTEPAPEAKLVRCVAGVIHDVLVDMRPESETYRNVVQLELAARVGASVYVPSGVAHGYQALQDGTEVLYMTDQFYQPTFEVGLRYSDPALGIEWPLPVIGVTPRDQQWPLLG